MATTVVPVLVLRIQPWDPCGCRDWPIVLVSSLAVQLFLAQQLQGQS